MRSSITPKTGNTFVGEYGAILDGTGWTTSDDTQAAFRAHNQDIDYVTIRNLVIRNMPQRGIHAYYWMSDHWTIEYNEIASNRMSASHFAPDSLIRNNYIHHNGHLRLLSTRAATWVTAHNSTLESNEIAYNGWEQKVGESANVTFRNNFVHHNVGDGIWYDSDNTGGLVEGNRVEDNGATGSTSRSAWTASSGTTSSGGAGNGVFISTSKNIQIYNNTLEHNFRGIQYFLNCPAVAGGTMSMNNSAHDNTITVGTQSGAWASALSYTLVMHLDTAGAVSERLEEPDLLPQHLPCAIAHWLVPGSGGPEVLESVAGTRAGCRRHHVQ